VGDMIKNIYLLCTQNTLYSYQILVKLEFSW